MVCGRLRTFSIFSAFERDDIVVRSCSVVVLCWACTSPFVFLFVESPVNFFVSHFVVFYVRWDSAKFRYSARFSARTNGKKPGERHYVTHISSYLFCCFCVRPKRATSKVEASGYISTGGHTSQLITRQNIYQNGPYTGLLAAIP